MEPRNENRTQLPRLRFSMLALLAVTTLCAVLIVAAKALLYEPPTNRIAAYEKAPSTRGKWFEVGPNRVQMRLMARNDRSGSLLYEDGRGTAIQNLVAQNSQVLSSSASWLDVVQIELEPTPDQIDVIEARVFDHKTRTLVSDVDPAFGWRMVAPDVLQIYGLGKLLPEKLDVWFRLHSYAAGDEVRTIAPTPTSSCEFADGTKITLSDIRPGLGGGWSSEKGFLGSAISDEQRIAAEFHLEWPQANDERLQIAAVLRSGEKVHPDTPHFFVQSMSSHPRQLMMFDASFADLDHFEVRPFGGRDRFFFDAVVLPKVSGQPFAVPPLITLPVAGGEIDQQISEFQPLDIRIAIHRGNWASGTQAGGGRAAVIPMANATDLDREFTIATTSRGLSLSLRTRIILVNSGPRSSNANLSSTGFASTTSGSSSAAAVTYRAPLDQVDAVEVKLKP